MGDGDDGDAPPSRIYVMSATQSWLGRSAVRAARFPPNSHPTPDYAVGLDGMNGPLDGREVVDFPNGKEWKITAWDGRQRITKPLHDHCANPA